MTFTPRPFHSGPDQGNADWGNILIFIALVFAMSWGFDHFIVRPQQEAARQAQIAAQALNHPNPTAAEAETPAPRPIAAVMAEGQRVTLQNDEVTAGVNLQRGRIDFLSLKKHMVTLKGQDPVTLLEPMGADYPAHTETGWHSADAKLSLPGAGTLWRVEPGATAQYVTLSWDNGAGLVFTRTLELDDKFMFTVTDRVTNKANAPVTLWPYALVTQYGVPPDTHSRIVHEGAIGYIGDHYLEENYRDWAKMEPGQKTLSATQGWLGITSHYFFVGVIPPQNVETLYRLNYQAPKANDKHAQARYQVDAQGPDKTIAPGATAEVQTHIFAGGKELRVLDTYESNLKLVHFDLVLDFGWFYFLTKPFYYVLTYLNDLVGNFGVAIILLTCMIRLAVFPLANTSFRSFARMKVVAPQVQALQKTYAHDRRKMQEELVKLYTREKVNPLSGCLPVVAQIPIFFAIYKVLNVAIEMRHAPFFGWIQDLTAPDPTSVFNLYGLLSWTPPEFLHFGVWPTLLFVLIMLQVRLSPPQSDKMMMVFFNYYYPVVVSFMMAKFAAGLVIYWCCSSFLSLAQQIFIMHRHGVDIHLFQWFKRPPATPADTP